MNINIDKNDIKVIVSIVESYNELNELITDLQNKLNEIDYNKKAASEKLELLKSTEANFISYLKTKYNCEFSANDLLNLYNENKQ
ncbi:hypothetical protein [uncultured Methanobrevibacter sp.]|uniref:hypothetical protein n=1 Tax=uncultured Methanobrevibacter sp. TaxID=253161 RepID=UPI0025F64162|nr:hypothetical protein [uncultured Methanobrevibacter sp.]